MDENKNKNCWGIKLHIYYVDDLCRGTEVIKKLDSYKIIHMLEVPFIKLLRHWDAFGL